MSVQNFTNDVSPQPITPFLSDKELAHILRMEVPWVRSHAEEIPGFVRVGAKYRFARVTVVRWLGNLEPLLLADEVAALLQVKSKWVYHNKQFIPGYIQLGGYVRFRPVKLRAYLDGTLADEAEVVQ